MQTAAHDIEYCTLLHLRLKRATVEAKVLRHLQASHYGFGYLECFSVCLLHMRHGAARQKVLKPNQGADTTPTKAGVRAMRVGLDKGSLDWQAAHKIAGRCTVCVHVFKQCLSHRLARRRSCQCGGCGPVQ